MPLFLTFDWFVILIIVEEPQREQEATGTMSIVNPYFEREAASEVSMKSQQDNNDQDVIMRNANND